MQVLTFSTEIEAEIAEQQICINWITALFPTLKLLDGNNRIIETVAEFTAMPLETKKFCKLAGKNAKTGRWNLNDGFTHRYADVEKKYEEEKYYIPTPNAAFMDNVGGSEEETDSSWFPPSLLP